MEEYLLPRALVSSRREKGGHLAFNKLVIVAEGPATMIHGDSYLSDHGLIARLADAIAKLFRRSERIAILTAPNPVAFQTTHLIVDRLPVIRLESLNGQWRSSGPDVWSKDWEEQVVATVCTYGERYDAIIVVTSSECASALARLWVLSREMGHCKVESSDPGSAHILDLESEIYRFVAPITPAPSKH